MVYREIARRARRSSWTGGVSRPSRPTTPCRRWATNYSRNAGALIFSGDTAQNDALWEVVNSTPDLKYLIIETAFSNKERDIAALRKHLCPQMLAEELAKMRVSPRCSSRTSSRARCALTMREVSQAAGRWRPRMLENNQEFSL